MKLLIKDSLKGAKWDTQKNVEDITNVITDFDFATATNYCVNNSVTDMTYGAIKTFWKNDCLS